MECKGLQVALAVVALAAATEVRAQQPVAFEELGRIVKPGQALVIRDAEGHAIKGRLVSTSAREIVITRSRTFRRDDEQTFQAGSVSRISRADSRWNGAVLGLAAGLAGAGAIAGTNEWNPDYGAQGAFASYGLLLGGIGAGVGLAIDDAIKPTIYESSAPRASLRIAPLVRGGRKGIMASLRF